MTDKTFTRQKISYQFTKKNSIFLANIRFEQYQNLHQHRTLLTHHSREVFIVLLK